MAKRLYTAAANGLDAGTYEWLTGTWKISLLSSAYTFDAAHDFHNDLSGILATATISGRTKTGGVWDADDPTFAAATGVATAAVIWKDSGVSSTSPLFMFDDAELLGLPLTLTGAGPILLTWDNGPNRIFALSTYFQ